MGDGVEFGLGLSLLAAFASIVTGRNLTRSITAGAISIGGLAVALVFSLIVTPTVFSLLRNEE